jgi:CheY-like chemotaxis protein
MRLLLVDDDIVARETLKGILGLEPGWQVDEFEDGLAAWEFLEGNPSPDLALLDIKMPKLDGIELLQRIRSQPRGSFLKVIMTTGVRTRETVLALAKLRIHAYLLKPYDQEKAIGALRQALFGCDCPSLALMGEVQERLALDLPHYVQMLDEVVGQLAGILGAAEDAVARFDEPGTKSALHKAEGICAPLGMKRFAELASRSLKNYDGRGYELPGAELLRRELEGLHRAREKFAAKLPPPEPASKVDTSAPSGEAAPFPAPAEPKPESSSTAS